MARFMGPLYHGGVLNIQSSFTSDCLNPVKFDGYRLEIDAAMLPFADS